MVHSPMQMESRELKITLQLLEKSLKKNRVMVLFMKKILLKLKHCFITVIFTLGVITCLGWGFQPKPSFAIRILQGVPPTSYKWRYNSTHKGYNPSYPFIFGHLQVPYVTSFITIGSGGHLVVWGATPNICPFKTTCFFVKGFENQYNILNKNQP